MKFSTIPVGSGATGEINGQPVAVYNDGGVLVVLDNTCTHLECQTEWNENEKSWDCPCHGARFANTGAVREGPAIEPLRPLSARLVGDDIALS